MERGRGDDWGIPPLRSKTARESIQKEKLPNPKPPKIPNRSVGLFVLQKISGFGGR